MSGRSLRSAIDQARPPAAPARRRFSRRTPASSGAVAPGLADPERVDASQIADDAELTYEQARHRGGWWWVFLAAGSFVAASQLRFGDTADTASLVVVAVALALCVLSVQRLSAWWPVLSARLRWLPPVALVVAAGAFTWGTVVQTEFADKPLITGSPLQRELTSLDELNAMFSDLDAALPDPGISDAEARTVLDPLTRLADLLDRRAGDHFDRAWPGRTDAAGVALATAEDAAAIWLRAVVAAADQPTPGRVEDRAAAEEQYRQARAAAVSALAEADAVIVASGRSWAHDQPEDAQP
jgi:hypothetical protein